MPLQDLTPQLRTRLTKVERSVGWFILLATVLLVLGFAYYLYHAARQKGWFSVGAQFYTYVAKGDGLNIGDKVFLMGFPVGQITSVDPMPPRSGHNVRIDFVINQLTPKGTPYFSYVWSEGSRVKLNSDFLGKHQLEVTRGTSGTYIYARLPLQTLSLEELQNLPDSPTNWLLAENIYDANSNLVFRATTNLTHVAEIKPASILAFHRTGDHRHITAVWNPSSERYEKYVGTNAYELTVDEPPAIGDQLQAMVTQIQQALPNVLALTNQLTAVLNHAAEATSNLNLTIAGTRPLVENFTAISSDLHGPGALGAWVLGTNGTFQLNGALTNANTLLANVDTNLDQLTDQVGLTLINLANITSNLNVQVQANSNMLGGISKTIMDSDDLIQGLKRHWLLRSAFKHKATNEPAASKSPPPTKTN